MAAFIIYIIRWGVVLTLLYSLYGLLMKRETLHGFNRIVLLLILVASMVLPLVQIETKTSNYVVNGREMLEKDIISIQQQLEKTNEPILHPSEYYEKLRQYDEMQKRTERQSVRTTEKLTSKHKEWPWVWTWWHVLLLFMEIYLLGLVIVWFRYIWQFASLLLLIHRGKRVDINGLPKHVHAVTHSAVKTPCSWMRWIFISPEDAGICAIIDHELAHVRLGHSWDMLLCELTCRMLWCVPFAWMLRQDLRDVHEYQADRRVLATGIRDEEYQLLLIRKATGTGLQPVVNALNQSPIKRRFKMMYAKPSRRWVALKGAYLLPLGAIALMAFARPQALGEIERKVEQAAPAIAVTVKTVAQQFTSPDEPGSDEFGIRQQGDANLKFATHGSQITNSAEREDLAEQNAIADSTVAMPDANLVKADLAGSQSTDEPYMTINGQRAAELLDSTMLAVGARKIADGTWIGHFQPSLNNDTVRVGKVEYLDKQSRLVGGMSFETNEDDPYAYNMVLQKETRKERTGYYIRKLYPAKTTERHYDPMKVDTKMLSTDEVLTGREGNLLHHVYEPVAIERSKKETRIYMYTGWRGHQQEDIIRQTTQRIYKDLAIIDEQTGDRYVCRSVDCSYFKHVKDEYLNKDTINIYQLCLVFPPLGKRVEKAYFGNADEGVRRTTSFYLKEIPNKARIITQ